VQYATCSLLQGRVSPAVTAAKSSCKSWTKQASLSIRSDGHVASRDLFFIKQVEGAFCVVPKRRDVLKTVALV
jgi:hypothetical protein